MSLLRNGVLDDDEEQSGRWENLPPELFWDIIRRLEETETCWPERVILSCASVCKSWRAITKDIVKTPELSGRLIFPTSLKQEQRSMYCCYHEPEIENRKEIINRRADLSQNFFKPGPRDSPIQCYIKRKRETSIYLLYLGSEPSENKDDKLLLAAKRKQRIRNTKYVISLVADDFRRTSKTYVGKLRSNFLDYKFTIYDTQPPHSNNNSQLNHKLSRCKYYNVGSITYKINMIHKCRVHRIKGPRKMSCSIMMMMKNSMTMELKSKDPIWDEQCQHWHLNFRHHDTLASDNFQLVYAADDEEHEHEQEQEEKVILEFAKIGEDVFVMDYCYPLSAFQAFAICLSNFDAKPTSD